MESSTISYFFSLLSSLLVLQIRSRALMRGILACKRFSYRVICWKFRLYLASWHGYLYMSEHVFKGLGGQILLAIPSPVSSILSISNTIYTGTIGGCTCDVPAFFMAKESHPIDVLRHGFFFKFIIWGWLCHTASLRRIPDPCTPSCSQYGCAL